MSDAFSADLAAIASIEAVEELLRVVCKATGMGFAAVARVTEDRWIACAVRDDIAFGLKPGGELPVATTLCREVRELHQAIVIDHVAEDADFCDHPTPRTYGFQSYISVPVMRQNGEFFGTLCALDVKPARLKTPETIGMFNLFAQLISLRLDLLESQTLLREEKANAELRENFIAVLGHDLRNPLSAINASAGALNQVTVDGPSKRLLRIIQNSSARMAELISNVVDLARARMGTGVPITAEQGVALGPTIAQVVTELCVAWPDRVIHSALQLEGSVDCDPHRIAQLLSNLLGNALSYGDAAQPVEVSARSDSSLLVLSVVNAGVPIPTETIRVLFQPYVRASKADNREGLGLGLYIASEIARAHGGTLEVSSSAAQTRFTFRMPARLGHPPAAQVA